MEFVITLCGVSEGREDGSWQRTETMHWDARRISMYFDVFPMHGAICIASTSQDAEGC